MEEYEEKKYWVTVHHNLLALEQWTKILMTASSSKSQNEQREVLCLQNKKVFWKVQGIYYVKKYVSTAKSNLETLSKYFFEVAVTVIVVNTWLCSYVISLLVISH